MDVLTMTRGMRVTSSGATAKYQGQSVDPRTAGRELGVDAIVDGSVRILGDRLRISARLIDVATGEQLWVDRFDGPLAGSARDRGDHGPTHRRAPAPGARGPRRATQRAAGGGRPLPRGTPEERARALAPSRRNLSAVLDLLDRAIEIAPDFALAIAAHADHSVRRWFLPAGQNDEAVARRAHESVARACALAPQVPLTHYAAGRLAVSDGRFGDAARELMLALALAPTYAEVHAYLGSLQLEAGRGDEGERHIQLASRLDATFAVGTLQARRFAFNRDLDRFREMIEAIRAKPTEARIRHRVDGDAGRRMVRRPRDGAALPTFAYVTPGHPVTLFLEAQRGALLGEMSEAELLASLEPVLASGSGPRLDAFMRQLAIEALAPMGAIESAMAQLRLVTERAGVRRRRLARALPGARPAALPSRLRGDGRERSGAGGRDLAPGVLVLTRP